MLDERARTREIEAFGGLWGKIPMFSTFFMIFAMASAGLPGLNNFVGEFLILTGTFKVAPLATALAFIGVILPLIYTVRLIQKLLFQEARQPLLLADLNRRELAVMGVLALGAFYLGLHPTPLLDMLKVPVALLIGGMP
jgi:NADH-quinone oxidoreductase subunit M